MQVVKKLRRWLEDVRVGVKVVWEALKEASSSEPWRRG